MKHRRLIMLGTILFLFSSQVIAGGLHLRTQNTIGLPSSLTIQKKTSHDLPKSAILLGVFGADVIFLTDPQDSYYRACISSTEVDRRCSDRTFVVSRPDSTFQYYRHDFLLSSMDSGSAQPALRQYDSQFNMIQKFPFIGVYSNNSLHRITASGIWERLSIASGAVTRATWPFSETSFRFLMLGDTDYGITAVGSGGIIYFLERLKQFRTVDSEVQGVSYSKSGILVRSSSKIALFNLRNDTVRALPLAVNHACLLGNAIITTSGKEIVVRTYGMAVIEKFKQKGNVEQLVCNQTEGQFAVLTNGEVQTYKVSADSKRP